MGDCYSLTYQHNLCPAKSTSTEHLFRNFKFQLSINIWESPSLSALDYLGYLTYVHLRKESSKFSLYENLFWSRIVLLWSFFNESGLWTTKER